MNRRCTVLPFLSLAACGLRLQAATVGFTGDFDPTYWQTNITGSGSSIRFLNDNIQLEITGPTSAASEMNLVSYLGPDGAGALFPSTVTINWYFNSGDSTTASATIGWGSASQPQSQVLNTLCGPGTVESGTFTCGVLFRGGISIMLDSTTASGGKVPAVFEVTDFSVVPEPSPGVLLGTGFGLVFWGRQLRRRVRSYRTSAESGAKTRAAR